MKNVKVLGTGCANCRNTQELIEEVAAAKGVQIALEKIEDMKEIVRLGVMSTPGVMIEGKLVHSGGVPARAKVEGWFAG
jgi:small redox-active disulfide protein 2